MGLALIQPGSHGVWHCGHRDSPALHRDSASPKLPRARMGEEDENSGWPDARAEEPCCDASCRLGAALPTWFSCPQWAGQPRPRISAQLPTLSPPAPSPGHCSPDGSN